MPIAVPDDVAAVLLRDLTTDEQALAVRLISSFQAELEARLGRSVGQREFTEEHDVSPPATGNPEVYVDRGPVVSVSSVADGDGNAVALADTHRRFGSVELLAGVVTSGPITVVYEGGWSAERAEPARQAIIDRVARAIVRAADQGVGVASQSVEGDSIRWIDDGFTETEMAAVSGLAKLA